MNEQKMVSLFHANLIKSSEDWKIHGIASSTSKDEEDDIILRENLDISYLQKRGYINWEHSSEPGYQLGYTTSAVLLDDRNIEQYKNKLNTEISPNSSLYIEGTLYKNVKKANEVWNILNSIEDGQDYNLGLSIEGMVKKQEDDENKSSILKAIIRGVAITTKPAHSETICKLAKSLQCKKHSDKIEKDLLSEQEAIIYIMEVIPNINYSLAKSVLDYINKQVL